MVNKFYYFRVINLNKNTSFLNDIYQEQQKKKYEITDNQGDKVLYCDYCIREQKKDIVVAKKGKRKMKNKRNRKSKFPVPLEDISTI